MRVWMVEQFGHGGIGRYAVDVANFLQDGHDVVVATSSMGPVPGLEGRAQHWFPRLPGAPGRALGGVVGLARALAVVRRGDLAWVPLGIRPGFELALVAVLRARGARVAATVHNRAPHGAEGESPTVLRAARLAHDVVVHTAALEGWAVRHRLPAVRLPFPPPDVRGANGPGRSRRDLGIPEGRLVVALLGYLYRYKGPDLLVRALARAVEDEPDLPVHVLLAGRRAKDLDLPALARECGVEDRVTVREGWLEEHELADLLELSQVVALPYREIDNTGMGALARQRGLVALASDLPALRELFGDAGLFVPAGDVDALADALRRLPRELPRLRAALPEAGHAELARAYRSFVEGLTAERVR